MSNGSENDGMIGMRNGHGKVVSPTAALAAFDVSNGGGVVPATTGSATFAFRVAKDGEHAFGCAYGLPPAIARTEAPEFGGPHPMEDIYARLSCPTMRACEDVMRTLEPGADWARVYPSGMGALAALVQGCCHQAMAPKEGGLGAVKSDVIIYTGPLYGGTYAYFTSLMLRFGFTGIEVKLTDPEVLRPILMEYGDRIGLVYTETPANPTLDMVDIKAVRAVMDQVYLRKHRPVLAVDNTFMGIFQQPLTLGADVVLYSATKYLSGHADLIGGFLVGKNDAPKCCIKPFVGGVVDVSLMDAVGFIRTISGLTVQSDTAKQLWLHMQTYVLRMQRQAEVANTVAEWLVKHPKVQKVLFPTMLTGANKAIFERQCLGTSAMISFVVQGDTLEASYRFLDALKHCVRAVSLGFVRTLVDNPSVWTHSDIAPEEQRRMGITPGLVRLSVGIEDPKDIITDLEQALAAV